jgi:hypothetical protein
MRGITSLLVALVEDRAATADREAGEAKERAAKIEASMMLRHLSKQAGEALCVEIPKSYANDVAVTSSSQDWESFRYAQDFAKALTKCIYAAGFGSRGFSGSLGIGNSFWSTNVTFGVWVRFPKHFTLDSPKSHDLMFNPSMRRALARKVRDDLEAHGVKVEGISDGGRALVDIYVGPRFPPDTDEPKAR